MNMGKAFSSIIPIMVCGLSSAQVSIEVKTQTNYTDAFYLGGVSIWPIWNRSTFVDITHVTPANLANAQHLFLEEAVLQTATGGRQTADGQDNEMYDAAGNYTFSTKLKPALDALMSKGIKPILVIGNTPFPLSNRTGMGFFNANVGKPTIGPGYDGAYGYVDYIKSLFQFLKANYQYASVPLSNWEFRLMTEPDNYDMWDPNNIAQPCDASNRTDYMTLYSKTYGAISSVLGSSSTQLNFGNFLEPIYRNGSPNPAWPETLANFASSNGYNIGSFSYSAYADMRPITGTQVSSDPRDLVNMLQGLAGLRYSIRYTYLNAKINLDETGLIYDENARTGMNAQSDITNVGGAWLAGMLKKSYDLNVNRYVLWDDFMSADGHVKTPFFNVLSVFKKMLGYQRTATTLPAGTGFPYIDAISGRKDKSNSIILFSYDPNRNNLTPTSTTLKISGLIPNTLYKIDEYTISANHSNYFPVFLNDVATDIGLHGAAAGLAALRDQMDHHGGNIISEYSNGILDYLDASTQYVWNSHVYAPDGHVYPSAKYIQAGELERTSVLKVGADATGAIVRNIPLVPNTVMYFEASPTSLVPELMPLR